MEENLLIYMAIWAEPKFNYKKETTHWELSLAPSRTDPLGPPFGRNFGGVSAKGLEQADYLEVNWGT